MGFLLIYAHTAYIQFSVCGNISHLFVIYRYNVEICTIKLLCVYIYTYIYIHIYYIYIFIYCISEYPSLSFLRLDYQQAAQLWKKTEPYGSKTSWVGNQWSCYAKVWGQCLQRFKILGNDLELYGILKAFNPEFSNQISRCFFSNILCFLLLGDVCDVELGLIFPEVPFHNNPRHTFPCPCVGLKCAYVPTHRQMGKHGSTRYEEIDTLPLCWPTVLWVTVTLNSCKLRNII